MAKLDPVSEDKKRVIVQRLRRKFKKLFGKEAVASADLDEEIWQRSLPTFSLSPAGWKKASDGDADMKLLRMMRYRNDEYERQLRHDDRPLRDATTPLTKKEQEQKARDAVQRLNPKRYAF